MDALFVIGQVVWIAVLACGAYVSFCFFDLADENAARTAMPKTLLQASPAARAGTGTSSPGVRCAAGADVGEMLA